MNPFNVEVPTFADLVEPPVKKKRGPKAGAKPSPAAPAPVPGATPPMTRNWKSGEYKPSPAMRLALDRAREHQPPLVMLSSLVRQDSVVRGEDK